MAEKDQKPTARRLREARKRGEIAFSRDVASTVVFLLVLAGLWIGGGAVYESLSELWLDASTGALFHDPAAGSALLLPHAIEVLLRAAIGISALAAVGGIAGSFLQVGGLVAWERVKPDVNRLNPAKGLEGLVSTRNVVNLLKMLLKTALLSGLMFVIVRARIGPALATGYGNPATIAAAGAEALLQVFAWAGVIYAVMAAIDYVHEHHEYIKGLRMSIDDIRRDYKDANGSPVHQSRRRAAHFEAVYASLGDRVRAASAVIHSARVAVALQYLGEHDLPRVIARGEGEVAAAIRRHAGDALIPLEFEPRLAEQLYEEVGIDQTIPRPLYEPVARLMRWALGG
jgi:type III secretion protein U